AGRRRDRRAGALRSSPLSRQPGLSRTRQGNTCAAAAGRHRPPPQWFPRGRVMRPEQLPLELPVRSAMNAAGFVVSDSNRDAVAWTDRWPDWPNGILAVYGPPGCGKTHLAHVWQAKSKARFLEPSALEQLPLGEHLVLD